MPSIDLSIALISARAHFLYFQVETNGRTVKAVDESLISQVL